MLTQKMFACSNIDLENAMTFLKENEGNHLAHLVFLKDKEIYMASNQQVMIVYRKKGKKFIVLGDPVGKKEFLAAAIEEFEHFCSLQNGTPVYYQISPKHLSYYRDAGYRFFKLGEEAIVDLDKFTIEGKSGAKLRTERNKFVKKGYQFKVLNPPHSAELLEELRNISNSWLDKRKEKSFSVSFFCEEYVSRFPVCLLQNAKGELIAFATLARDYKDGQKTVIIDLMRHISVKPNGTMDMLFISILLWAKKKGYSMCSLGMAPLSNVGTHFASPKKERLARLLFLYGNALYKFQGLKKFKSKFANVWEPKYLVYRHSFFTIVLQLFLVIHRSKFELGSAARKVTVRKKVG